MTHSLCVEQLCKSVTCWNRTHQPCHLPSDSVEMCHLAHNAMPSGSCLYLCVYIPTEIFLGDTLIRRYSGYQLSAGSLAYQVCLSTFPWFVFDKCIGLTDILNVVLLMFWQCSSCFNSIFKLRQKMELEPVWFQWINCQFKPMIDRFAHVIINTFRLN